MARDTDLTTDEVVVVVFKEFEAKRADIHALRAATTPDLRLLRIQARAAGKALAATVREKLLTP